MVHLASFLKKTVVCLAEEAQARASVAPKDADVQPGSHTLQSRGCSGRFQLRSQRHCEARVLGWYPSPSPAFINFAQQCAPRLPQVQLLLSTSPSKIS